MMRGNADDDICGIVILTIWENIQYVTMPPEFVNDFIAKSSKWKKTVSTCRGKTNLKLTFSNFLGGKKCNWLNSLTFTWSWRFYCEISETVSLMGTAHFHLAERVCCIIRERTERTWLHSCLLAAVCYTIVVPCYREGSIWFSLYKSFHPSSFSKQPQNMI